MDKRPLISVIVPVYGTEKYLRKCLDSILNQTYKEIELIVVNDASKDKSEDIIMEYMRMDERVKYVRHSKNRGLFQARISGVEEATGEYIAFVDSDDYISCDFYRMLVKKAEETGADMVLADFCLEYENGSREYFNLDPIRVQDLSLSGDEVLCAYMEQEGLCYSWQLVWNKLIKRELWKKCEADYVEFSNKKGHLIMTEDIAFSCLWWMRASKVTNVHNGLYFYVQNSNQSVKQDKTYKKYKKNETDVLDVFSFFKRMLEKEGKYERYSQNYKRWKQYYGRIYYGIFNDLPEKRGLTDFGYEAFELEEICWPSYSDNYFYSIKTSLDDRFWWFEDIKKAIVSDTCEVVSFDVFDTLLLRPFFKPTDLFLELNTKFIELFGITSYVQFSEFRVEAERECRKLKKIKTPAMSEITLDEIYEYIGRKYKFDMCKLTEIKHVEEELEYRYSLERRTGKELYTLAVQSGKRIVFTSDMYLSQECVLKMLQKHGYNNGKLYLSSTLAITKADGTLFNYVIKTEKVKAEEVVHIGDNWHSDVEVPNKKEIKAFHLMKPIDVFKNAEGAMYGGQSYKVCYDGVYHNHDMINQVNNYAGLRILLAQVANRLYDNPYNTINKESDFNANPFSVGYYALGMYMFGIFKWLQKEVKKDRPKKVHFVARDGYLMKEIYDEFKKMDSDLPESNYLYISRATTILLDMNSPEDLYSLRYKLNARYASPKSVLILLKDVLSVNEETVFQELGIVAAETKFGTQEGLDQFISELREKFSKYMDFVNFKMKYKSYFENVVEENSAIFDIGYNGRVELALTNLLGYPVKSYYIHRNSDKVFEKMKKADFGCESFYSYKPAITGVLREHVMMKLSGSTIGYDFSNDEVKPILEKYSYSFQEKYVTSVLQNAAISFIKDLINHFGTKVFELYFETEDATAVMEYYLHESKKIDRKIFSCLMFEDMLGEGKKMRALDFWNENLENAFSNSFYHKRNMDVCIDRERIGSDKDRIVLQLPSKTTRRIQNIEKQVGIFLDVIGSREEISRNDKFAKCAGNTSNLVFWDSILKLLSPRIIPNWYMTNPGGFNEEEYEVFLTTNLVWIQEGDNLTYLEKTLNRIGDKILLPVGIGLSAENEKKNFKLSAESISVLKKIAERCKSVGVRGEYTAEVLSQYGIKNCRIIGCPSLYSGISELKDLRKDVSRIKKVSGSVKPFYGLLSNQEILLLSWFEKNKVELVDTTVLELQKNNMLDETIYEKLKLYEQRKNIYFDVNLWRNELRKMEFAMGMNFHNNVLALQAGVPALFVTYETSAREMCKYFGLPYIDITEFDSSKSLTEYYHMADYAKCNSKMSQCCTNFKEFLKENNVAIHDAIKVIEK